MTISPPEHQTLTLYPGQVLIVVADALGEGSVFRLGDSAGSAGQGVTSITTSSTTVFGPFTLTTRWDIIPTAGLFTVSQSLPTVQQLVDALGGVAVDTSGNVTAKTVTTTGDSGTQFTLSNGQVLVSLATAITANSTTTTAPAGSIGITSHATGVGKLFMSDGSKWQFAGVA